MKLSVIVVSWQVRDALESCLNSIKIFLKDINLEVFVIDNFSQDGTKEMMINNFNEYFFVENDSNQGFAKASNQGIKKSTGDYILLLNPDSQFLDNSILKAIKYFESHHEIGILGCKIFDVNGGVQPSVRKFPDLLSHLILLLKIHHLFPNLNPYKNYIYHDFNYSNSQLVDQVMGAFFLVKRQVFKEVGLLNENFFVWYEEVDFCKRAKEAGWGTVYFPDTAINHIKAASFSQLTPLQKQILFNRSMLHYFSIHHNFFSYFI